MLDCTVAYGLSFLFPARDSAVGASLRRHGEFARPELDFLIESAAQESGTFIDVGANIGAIALPFAHSRPRWRTLAIEAHRGLHAVLSANALNNRLDNVETFHAAAGAARGLVEFPEASLGEGRNFGMLRLGAAAERTEPVRMLTLDELAPEDTQIIKIDVEGYEPEVLAGAQALLARRSAIWLAEASVKTPEASARTISAFLEAGYSVHWFYAPFATPASAKDPPTNIARGDANVVALPPGAPNRWRLPQVKAPDEKRPGDGPVPSGAKRCCFGIAAAAMRSAGPATATNRPPRASASCTSATPPNSWRRRWGKACSSGTR
jgi:FkbM family methyltransferase